MMAASAAPAAAGTDTDVQKAFKRLQNGSDIRGVAIAGMSWFGHIGMASCSSWQFVCTDHPPVNYSI